MPTACRASSATCRSAPAASAVAAARPGCWNTELDGAALARLLGRPLPADEVTFTRGVLAAASEGGREEMRAARAVARALGRGTAGLVNACDPERVVFCGLAATMLSVAPESIDRAYLDGLMTTRAAAPPEIVAGALGDRAPLVGAMEEAFAPVLGQPGALSAGVPARAVHGRRLGCRSR